MRPGTDKKNSRAIRSIDRRIKPVRWGPGNGQLDASRAALMRRPITLAANRNARKRPDDSCRGRFQTNTRKLASRGPKFTWPYSERISFFLFLGRGASEQTAKADVCLALWKYFENERNPVGFGNSIVW